MQRSFRGFFGKASLLLILTGLGAFATFASPALHAQDITGIWQGTLQFGKGLRTVLKITKANTTGLAAVLYSIDQNGQPLPVTSITLQGTNVRFTITPVDIVYTGTLSADGKTITGNSVQGGQTAALTLTRTTEDNAWPIPEPPKHMAADANPSFDVVTIKPSDPSKVGKGFGFRGRHFTTFHTNVNDLIAVGYGLHAKQIIGAPAWLNTDLYDIDGVPDVEGQPSEKQREILLQKLLVDRFALKFHYEKRELAVYAITIAKGGPKLTKSVSAPEDPISFFYRNLGQLTVRNLTIAGFAEWMQASAMDRPVVDQTGLTDRYDFKLNWTPDESQFAQFRSGGWTPPPAKDDANEPPGLYTAIQEQLGLKMEPVKAPDQVMVIDHVEHPSAN